MKNIDFNKLAHLTELQGYLREDPHGFKVLVFDAYHDLNKKIATSFLPTLALIRALELTNGCAQWGFRGGSDKLSPEKTREAMKMVMGFMKNSEFYFPSIGKIIPSGRFKEYIREVREMYIAGFKKQNMEEMRRYYATSVAQFSVLGKKRMETAFTIVRKDYGSLFGEHYLQLGWDYCFPYLNALTEPK